MYCHLVRREIDVSEENIASIFRAQKLFKQESAALAAYFRWFLAWLIFWN
jgi:hypothetical protein